MKMQRTGKLLVVLCCLMLNGDRGYNSVVECFVANEVVVGSSPTTRFPSLIANVDVEGSNPFARFKIYRDNLKGKLEVQEPCHDSQLNPTLR